jgi:hypothetical protein
VTRKPITILGLAEWLDDHAGHPLGPGMPTGSTLRGADGTTHLAGWADVVRRDPCSYCGAPGGTLDHIVPQSTRRRGVHSWLNYAGACERCNGRKRDRTLLWYLATRPRAAPRRRRLPRPVRTVPLPAAPAARRPPARARSNLAA